MMLFNSVVLPTPLRPRRHTTWPGGTSRCTSHSTWLSPYDTLRPRIVSIDLMPSAQVNLDHTRVALHHVDGALAQDTALVQDRHTMGRLTHKLHVVLHDQHRMVLRQTLQELTGTLALVFSHAGYRLI